MNFLNSKKNVFFKPGSDFFICIFSKCMHYKSKKLVLKISAIQISDTSIYFNCINLNTRQYSPVMNKLEKNLVIPISTSLKKCISSQSLPYTHVEHSLSVHISVSQKWVEVQCFLFSKNLTSLVLITNLTS